MGSQQYSITFKSIIMKTWSLFLICSLLFLSSCEVEEDFSPSGSSQQEILAGTTLTVSSIDQFNWITGNQSWIEQSIKNLWNSRFIFSSGDRFIYSFRWAGTNEIHTLNGEYFKISGHRYQFYAVKNSNNGAGSGTQTLVKGMITPLSRNKYRVTMEYDAGSNNSATVNNQSFFLQTSKRFTTTMDLQ
jgi:hypothetical protein